MGQVGRLQDRRCRPRSGLCLKPIGESDAYATRRTVATWLLGTAHRLDRAKAGSVLGTSAGWLPLGGSVRKPSAFCFLAPGNHWHLALHELRAVCRYRMAERQVY